MEYIKYPNNFFELPEPLSNYENSKVVILSVPYEKTTTYIHGTKDGPSALLKASLELEFYDEELGQDSCEVGICTLNELKIDDESEVMVNVVSENVKKLINDNKFPIILGGEHSITIGCVKAFAEKYDELSVLQLDAHGDLKEENYDSKFNHGCAMKRCLDICQNLVPVGIRSLNHDEADFAKEKDIKIFWAKDVVDNDGWFDDAISRLSKNVYITIDLDGLDPSWMPAVGNPEPGGLQYYSILRFLRKVCKERNVVGFDVVELCPKKDDVSSDLAAAKVMYKLIGYVFDKK
ncbi:agmatinase [Candidatus Woesearchaeota archaeon]|nr:agmatinase [Candidatus Woesearchaeota archaeon]|tara:strand:- start:576 stop:1451 length:876 start_codon:yes stop_codon:yes gene_type:complete